MAALRRSGVGRIVLADLGKNVHAYVRGAQESGVTIMAIGDDRFASPDRRYRGVLVLPLAEALDLRPDAVVVGNMSAVHGAATYERLIAATSLPVFHWYGPDDPANSTDSPRRLVRRSPRSLPAKIFRLTRAS